jgi:hypothetical protein
MTEEGIWTEYKGLRAWCTSAHLVPDKEIQLKRAWERQEHARRQREALEPTD